MTTTTSRLSRSTDATRRAREQLAHDRMPIIKSRCKKRFHHFLRMGEQSEKLVTRKSANGPRVHNVSIRMVATSKLSESPKETVSRKKRPVHVEPLS